MKGTEARLHEDGDGVERRGASVPGPGARHPGREFRAGGMMAQFERIRAEVENYSAQETSSLQTSSSLRTDPFNAFPTPETSES